MGTDLRTHPKVIRIASALHADRFRVIGGLHAAWCLFDAHSIDGRLVGYTPEVMDDLIGWPGFTNAMMTVDWATFDGDSVALPRFDAHNGASAKRRAMETDRKQKDRSERKPSACKADIRPQKVSPRERVEKDKKQQEQEPSALFESWWAVYPKKVARKVAIQKWTSRGMDAIADVLIADVLQRAAKDDRWQRGYVPDPVTYLNQERWNDDLHAAPMARATTNEPSKTLGGMQKLQGIRHGLAGNRTTERADEVALLGLGSDPGE